MAMTRPLLSVVMAVHDGERFLEGSIRSILQQSFNDFEFVIVDDGSTDMSPAIIEQFARLDSRIVALNQPHQGLVASLNRGCLLGQGRYIARLDSDDVAKDYRFEHQVAHLQANPQIALVGGSTDCIDAYGNSLFVMHWPAWSEGLRDYLLVDCTISHTTTMFRKDAFIKVGGYRHAYVHAEDYDLFLRLSDHFILDNLRPIMCEYRLHKDQVSQVDYAQQILSAIAARIATRERRAGHPEPNWAVIPVSRDELMKHRVLEERIEALIADYRVSNMHQSLGWRWRSMPFCEIRKPSTHSA